MAETIQESRGKVVREFGHFEANRLHELRQALGNCADELKRLGQLDGTAEQIAGERLRLASAALRLQQIAIPALTEIADSALEVAGANAVREACRPTRSWNDKEVPSEFKVPAQFGGIADKARSAVRSLVGG